MREELVAERRPGTRVVAVSSGKGGVGKSNLSANLALAAAALGRRTLIVDADLSLANVDVLCGIVPSGNLGHVRRGEKSLEHILESIAEGVDLIPGASGLPEFVGGGREEAESLLGSLRTFAGKYDLILIDTPAGLDLQILSFLTAADQVLLVTTPEPTALTDVYALVKALAKEARIPPVAFVVNRVSDAEEGRRAAERLRLVARRFLDLELDFLGAIPEDGRVVQAVKMQRPFFLAFPRSPASLALVRVTARLLDVEVRAESQGLESFLRRLWQRFGRLPA